MRHNVRADPFGKWPYECLCVSTEQCPVIRGRIDAGRPAGRVERPLLVALRRHIAGLIAMLRKERKLRSLYVEIDARAGARTFRMRGDRDHVVCVRAGETHDGGAVGRVW